MSKQVGLIKVKGNLDGVSFYQSQGEHFVRMAKGPSKNRILTDPAFKRTRENNSEFGGSAQAAKAFRGSLAPVLSIADKLLTSRTLKVLKTINSKGIGIRGKRPIEISNQRALLENLELNLAQSLGGVFKAPYTFTHNADRTSATVQIQEFNPEEAVVGAPGTTHFRLVQVIGVVSDYAYDAQTLRYQPVAPMLNMINTAAYSAYLPLETDQKLLVNLTTALENAPALPTNVSAVLGLGITFHQQIGNVYYPLTQADAFKIISVF